MTMDTASPETLLSIAKSSGRCPPSLVGDDRVIDGGEFEALLLRCLDRSSPQSLVLSFDGTVSDTFASAMKMADSDVFNSGLKMGVAALEHRRSLLLATLGRTAEESANNPNLRIILNNGFLVKVKMWLEDILSGKVGGVDLLLHLLSNISPLPVTKEMVTSSRLGKAVASLEKNKICVGTLNETSIKSRVAQVKERWSASVKLMKNAPQSISNAPKRPPEEDGSSAAKRIKREVPTASLSNLLKKVENVNNPGVEKREAKIDVFKESPDGKKDERRIRWADSNGKALAVAEEKASAAQAAVETEKPVQDPRLALNRPSWSDRKKKDLLHEKELLLQARKSDNDEDKQDALDAMAMMVVAWKPPQLLPEDNGNPPVQVDSKELITQNDRIQKVQPVRYSNEIDVPNNPTNLSHVERAVEFRSRNTSAPQIIPFFTPQPVSAPKTDLGLNTMNQPASTFAPAAVLPDAAGSTEATVETVLMMGLPLFLVGSNIQALQTLAATPNLLKTFRDANGVYDQARLMNLVQTLTQNLAPAQSSQPQNQVPAFNGVNVVQNNQNYYQPNQTQYTQAGQSIGLTNSFSTPGVQAQQQQLLQQPQTQQPSRGYRGDQNTGEANLHLSGYGPMTTNEEIIALFAPYVHVVEVVQKNGFSFVNTRDPDGAKRAREALNGALLGGSPVRINIATRKEKNPNRSHFNSTKPSSVGSSLSTLPRNNLGQIDFDQVCDDRGNPSTKNLFIAGYGTNTTEQQLRELVGQHANVISVVMKGTFAFVNTSDRDAAVMARESLSGTLLNGGYLRINFAKESGRLGTSFDQTYGPASSSSSYGSVRSRHY